MRQMLGKILMSTFLMSQKMSFAISESKLQPWRALVEYFTITVPYFLPIYPRRHTKAHEEQKTTAKAIDIKANIESNKELRITKFSKLKNSHSFSLQHSELLVHYSIFRIFKQNKPGKYFASCTFV
jgi:hypothetical protein